MYPTPRPSRRTAPNNDQRHDPAFPPTVNRPQSFVPTNSYGIARSQSTRDNSTPPISIKTSGFGFPQYSAPNISRYNQETLDDEIWEDMLSPNKEYTVTQPNSPDKTSSSTVGTSVSHSLVIDPDFQKLHLGTSPSPSAPRPVNKTRDSKMVIVADSDSDSDSDSDFNTDDPPIVKNTMSIYYERGLPPTTRPSSSHGSQGTQGSSFPSANSLFSTPSFTSSISSISSSLYSDLERENDKRPVVRENATSRHQQPPFHSTYPNASSRPNLSPDWLPEPRNIAPATSTVGVGTRPLTLLAETHPSGPVESSKINPVEEFASGPFGTNLRPIIIAHCDHTQRMMDEARLSWGTQYELARGVSSGKWTWEQVRSKVPMLKGTNIEAAYKVYSVMKQSVLLQEPSELALWEEFDREQAAIEEEFHRGLGLMGDFMGAVDWYGGKIQQRAKLEEDPERGLRVVLQRLEKRRSHRFARYYGSRRFIQLRISDDLLKNSNAEIVAFLTGRFILCGRTYVPFHPKEGSLYMVETNEDFGRSKDQYYGGDNLRLSFNDFINWHNPLLEKKNSSQVMVKYVARFALGLSNSVPALEFKEENILFIDDIAASDWPKGAPSPPADKLMTDGCGFLNLQALSAIVNVLGYDFLPAAVQGRIDGSKGVWILHPTDRSDQPKIWIRKSQNKIKNRSYDRAHLIFDLVAPSKPSGSAALSQQSILNLYSNGIPASTLIRLMEEGLVNEIQPLLEWDTPHAMVFLWDAINKCGNISGSRTQRLTSSLSRAYGLKGRDWGHVDAESDDDLDEEDDGLVTYTGRNRFSGAPRALHEVAMELVQAGFHPSNTPFLHEKIKWIISNLITKSIDKCRIPIEESLTAYVIPDPFNVLQEGEIFYRFSKPRKDPKTQMLYHVLKGPVVAGRYPIQLPSDMQKVVAVDRHELYNYMDVVVISTRGTRSLANLLSGGDMDGDDLAIYYDPAIVESFVNKPITDPPPDLISANFDEITIESVNDFCKRAVRLMKAGKTQEANTAFQEILMAQLEEDQKGLYDYFHNIATAKFGYGHAESIRLAHIFATLLDAPKTGYKLKPGILDKDWGRFGSQMTNTEDILTLLKKAAHLKGDELLSQHAKLSLPWKPDDILTEYYRTSASHSAQAYRDGYAAFFQEDERIRNHVKQAHKIWLESLDADKLKKQVPPKAKKSKFLEMKSDQSDVSYAASRFYAEKINGLVLTRDVEKMKASYAFQISPAFAFAVAFQEICHLKALSSPSGITSSLRIFDEAKSISSSYLRVLKTSRREFL